MLSDSQSDMPVVPIGECEDGKIAWESLYHGAHDTWTSPHAPELRVGRGQSTLKS